MSPHYIPLVYKAERFPAPFVNKCERRGDNKSHCRNGCCPLFRLFIRCRGSVVLNSDLICVFNSCLYTEQLLRRSMEHNIKACQSLDRIRLLSNKFLSVHWLSSKYLFVVNGNGISVAIRGLFVARTPSQCPSSATSF